MRKDENRGLSERLLNGAFIKNAARLWEGG